MTKLTEEIVRQRLRNCSAPLDTITKINITGRDLEDISILRRMTGIEVLSLSVNKITTLADLQYCKSLKELHLRKNNINNLNEIYYLKDLPSLKVLGLSQNPCSSEASYRMTIIKNLPKLEQLDDVPVVPEERVEALKKGKRIRNPQDYRVDSQESMTNLKIDHSNSPNKCIEEKGTFDVRMKEDQLRGLNYGHDLDSVQPEKVYCINGMRDGSRMQSPVNKMRASSFYESYSPGLLNTFCYKDGPGAMERGMEMRDAIRNSTPPYQERHCNGTGYQNHRDSNVLSGILVLIKELDYPSLELLSINIKNRLNEHQMNTFYQ